MLFDPNNIYDCFFCLLFLECRQLLSMIKDWSILFAFIDEKKKEFNRMNDEKIRHKLNLDVRSRWNSTYKMLVTLNMHRPMINQLFQEKTVIDITKKQ